MNAKISLAISAGALLLAAVLFLRISTVKSDFSRTVRESHKTTEGYDQRFIDRANRFEQVLLARVTFGYPGGKDPMTGQLRLAAKSEPPKPGAAPNRSASSRPAVAKPVAQTPQISLTAVISDPHGKKLTALVMQGEHSFSVDVGDQLAGGRVGSIASDGVLVETPRGNFFYDLNGHIEKRP